MKNKIGEGKQPSIIAPSAVTSGQLVIVGALVGVAFSDAAEGAAVTIATSGVFELPKGATAFDLGDRVYFDGSDCTDDNTDTFVGLCYEAVDSSAATVKVILAKGGFETPAALDAADIPYDNTDSDLAATDVQAAIDEVVAEKVDIDCLVYKALITQTGTDDPVATVLGENTIGNIVWTRFGAGTYYGTLAGAFTAGKTAVIPAPSFASNPIYGFSRVTGLLGASEPDVIALQVKNKNTDTFVDDVLRSAYVEIKVYP